MRGRMCRARANVRGTHAHTCSRTSAALRLASLAWPCVRICGFLCLGGSLAVPLVSANLVWKAAAASALLSAGPWIPTRPAAAAILSHRH